MSGSSARRDCSIRSCSLLTSPRKTAKRSPTPAKFAGQKGGAKNLAGRDYQRRMASIFKEQRRVLKPDGIMTVMFTHKAAGAWTRWLVA